jgi:cyclophilin family peptidyl-prolyl cis-trans isomerase/HEAT repeat protein
MRRVFRALSLTVVAYGAMTRCASSPVRSAGGDVAPPPAPIHGFSSLEEAEPSLLGLEDRRAWDRTLLEQATASADPAVRCRAAVALGRIGDERASGPLSRLLADSNPEVRAAAAFGAGILGEPGLTKDLAPLLSDTDPRVVVRAAWAIGFLDPREAEETLAAAVPGAATPEPRAAVLRGLWRFSTPAAAAAALPYVADPDVRIHEAALYALARRPQESSLATLTAALPDPDEDTAALAARALGILGRKESIGPLAAAIDGPRTPVTINAMAALEAVIEKNPGISPPADRSARLLALAGDANPNLAVPALTLLRWLASDREVFRRLWSVASTGAGRRQQVALQSLMAGLSEESENLTDAAIESPNRFLRAAAAESLSFLPEADAEPRRARLAADPEVVVRLKVLEGLRTPIAARSNRALVAGALADPDPGVRAAAVEALALTADAAVLPMILQAVQRSAADREPDVPIAAIGAAEKWPGEPAARAIVEGAYRHPSTLVSRLGRRSLVKSFHADPATLTLREYVTGKSISDYAALLAEARLPWTAAVETVRGAFRIRLAGKEASITSANFLQLARRGFFDGVVIHRVVPNFVVQDGDPTATGNGGPGYEIRDEIGPIPYVEGSVGMALSGPDTGGSQWFITHAPQPHLDGIYTLFGQVISGMDVVKRIEQGDSILRVTVSMGPS